MSLIPGGNTYNIGNPSDWAEYPATSNVDMDFHTMSNTAGLSINTPAPSDALLFTPTQIHATVAGNPAFTFLTIDAGLSRNRLYNLAQADFVDGGLNSVQISPQLITYTAQPNLPFNFLTLNIPSNGVDIAQILTINGENSKSQTEFFPCANFDLGTTGAPGAWILAFTFPITNPAILKGATIDVHAPLIAVSSDNGANYAWIMDYGIIGDNMGVAPINCFTQHKGWAVDWTVGILNYPTEINPTWCLVKGIDYDDNTTSWEIYINGGANNPHIFSQGNGGGGYNAWCRGFPY